MFQRITPDSRDRSAAAPWIMAAHPPHSGRRWRSGKETDGIGVCSGRMWRANRSGNTMMVSNASDPQISVRIKVGVCRDRAQCSAAAVRRFHPLAAFAARTLSRDAREGWVRVRRA